MEADIVLENHFTLFLACPQNDNAAGWLHETAPADAMFFGSALIMEPRYVEGFVAVARGEGFEVN